MLSGRNSGHGAGRVVQQGLGDHGVGTGNSLEGTSDGEDTVMDAGDDLADAGLDTSLVAEVGNVLSRLANDDTSFLGGDYGAEGNGRNSILLVGANTLLLAILIVVLVIDGEIVKVGLKGLVSTSGMRFAEFGGVVGHDC